MKVYVPSHSLYEAGSALDSQTTDSQFVDALTISPPGSPPGSPQSGTKAAHSIPSSPSHSHGVDLSPLSLAILPRDAYLELTAQHPSSPIALIDIRPIDQRRVKDRNAGILGALIVDADKILRLFNPSARDRHAFCQPSLRAILLCADGQTSTSTANALRTLGLSNASSVAGGFTAWQEDRVPREIPAHWWEDPSYPASDDEIIPSSEGEEELRLSEPQLHPTHRTLHRHTSPSPNFPGSSTIWVEVLLARREQGLPTDDALEASRFEYLRRYDQDALDRLPWRHENLYWALRPTPKAKRGPSHGASTGTR